MIAVSIGVAVAIVFVVGHILGRRSRRVDPADQVDIASAVADAIRTNRLGCLTAVCRAIEQGHCK